MAETTTPTSTPAGNGAFSAGLKGLLDTGLNVFTGYTNAQSSKSQADAAKAAAAAAKANAQGQQYSATKFYVIGGVAVVIALGLLIYLLKGKGR